MSVHPVVRVHASHRATARHSRKARFMTHGKGSWLQQAEKLDERLAIHAKVFAVRDVITST